jgi:transcriptional regulator with XRE-family HTH domain
MSRRFLLHASRIHDLADRHHLTQAEIAEKLGIARAYWSQLVNRRRALSPSIRRRILACDLVAGVAESELWERVAIPASEAA